jgi:hypothetical protein
MTKIRMRDVSELSEAQLRKLAAASREVRPSRQLRKKMARLKQEIWARQGSARLGKARRG